MSASLFTYLYNCISQGYPFVESLFNLTSLVDEIVIVDCGSTDGTRELLTQLATNPHIRIYDDQWIMGRGGRNFSKTATRCHELCQHDTIVFTEADEVWDEDLVVRAGRELARGHNNLKFHRFQVTQNFNRIFWYPERLQEACRIFPRGSDILADPEAGDPMTFDKSLDAQAAQLVGGEHGYIVDCRNNFRDSYLLREETSKQLWGEEARDTIRFTPAHTAYRWELPVGEFKLELADERWTWRHTPIHLPRILRRHVGASRYAVKNSLLTGLLKWRPRN
jgi:glycosyltransferase involved in cell wall biosynthesis